MGVYFLGRVSDEVGAGPEDDDCALSMVLLSPVSQSPELGLDGVELSLHAAIDGQLGVLSFEPVNGVVPILRQVDCGREDLKLACMLEGPTFVGVAGEGKVGILDLEVSLDEAPCR
jgi:hypothetical protein